MSGRRLGQGKAALDAQATTFRLFPLFSPKEQAELRALRLAWTAKS